MPIKGWHQNIINPDYARFLAQNGCMKPKAFTRGKVSAILTIDGPKQLVHLCVFCDKRLPAWEEVDKARYELVPDEITLALYFPPPSERARMVMNAFHLLEVRSEPRIINPNAPEGRILLG